MVFGKMHDEPINKKSSDSWGSVKERGVVLFDERYATDPAQVLDNAKRIAARLRWPLLSLGNDLTAFDLALQWDAGIWQVLWLNEPLWKPVWFDYSHPRFMQRLHRAGLRSEPLLKALGRRKPRTILDATGGTGQETMLLAKFGLRVTIWERQPVIALLLEDALIRAGRDGRLDSIIDNITFHEGCAGRYLAGRFAESFDVIYLDPMFPKRSKTAQVSKTMRLFQQLAQPDSDPVKLLELAFLKATKRVIVKRPTHSSPVSTSRQPSYQIAGPTIRYDIYLQ